MGIHLKNNGGSEKELGNRIMGRKKTRRMCRHQEKTPGSDQEDEDAIHLLHDAEALELVEFDPDGEVFRSTPKGVLTAQDLGGLPV